MFARCSRFNVHLMKTTQSHINIAAFVSLVFTPFHFMLLSPFVLDGALHRATGFHLFCNALHCLFASCSLEVLRKQRRVSTKVSSLVVSYLWAIGLDGL